MKKFSVVIFIVLLFAVLILVKFLFFPAAKEKQDKVGVKPTTSISASYFLARFEEVGGQLYSSGKIAAFNEVELMPEISGRIIQIFFHDGENVKKGQLLVKLNDADLQAQLQKNKAQLSLAELKLTRLKKLLEIKGVSQEEYDLQENEVHTLQADQKFINSQLAKTNIVSPFNGVIGLRNISEGATVNPGTSIALLVQLKPLYIEFSLPQRYYPLIKKGDKVEFETEDFSRNQKELAEIYALEPKVEPLTKSVKIRAIYKGKEMLYPGSFVKVYTSLSKRTTLIVPNQCVIPILKAQKVFIAKNGMAEERMIITGNRTDEYIEVLEGLMEGDTVLTTSLLAVKPGAKLTLIPAVKK